MEVFQQGRVMLQSDPNCLIEATGFHVPCFQQAVLNWIVNNNHTLQEIETLAFREVIAAANPDMEAVLPKNYQIVYNNII